MNLADLAILGAAGIVSTAAIVAVAVNRFRNVAAGSFALAAGSLPWVFAAIWRQWIPDAPMLALISMFASGPLFFIATILYGFRERTPLRSVAVIASLLGMFAGLGFTVILTGQLARLG